MKVTFNWSWKKFTNFLWSLYFVIVGSIIGIAIVIGIGTYEWGRVPQALHLLTGQPTVYNVNISKDSFDELIETNDHLSICDSTIFKQPKIIPLKDRWKYDTETIPCGSAA